MSAIAERCLYIIAESIDGPVKIGISNNPHSRLQALQTGNPRPLSLVCAYRIGSDAGRVERALHLELAEAKIEGEWFDYSPAFMRDYMPDFWRSEGYEFHG